MTKRLAARETAWTKIDLKTDLDEHPIAFDPKDGEKGDSPLPCPPFPGTDVAWATRTATAMLIGGPQEGGCRSRHPLSLNGQKMKNRPFSPLRYKVGLASQAVRKLKRFKRVALSA